MSRLDTAGLERLWTHVLAKLGGKVDIVAGKGLSTNDYTIEDKNKLIGIEAEANKTTIDSLLVVRGAAADAKAVGDAIADLHSRKADAEEGKGLSTNDYTDEEKEKLEILNTLVGDTSVSEQIGAAITEAITAITSEEIEEICGTLEGGVEVPEGVVAFADQATGKTHSVYVSDGKLYMAEVE